MVKAIHEQLTELLTLAGWDAWAEDCVPPEAAYPLVTFQVAMPRSPGGEGLVTLRSWHRGGAAHSARIASAQRLAWLFPHGGTAFRSDAGVAVLFPAPGGCVTFSGDGELLGAEMRLTLLVFPAGKEAAE